MESLPLGIAHGRFQPPHNGHIRYILASLARAEKLVIGIATPTICTEEEAARTGYPCTQALNPFTFEERAEMIKAALDEAGIPEAKYSFANLKSDYSNIEQAVPKDAVFLMSVTGPSDAKKTEHLASLGYRSETVMEILEAETREHSGDIRNEVRGGNDSWRTTMPPSIQKYMESHGLLDRLR